MSYFGVGGAGQVERQEITQNLTLLGELCPAKSNRTACNTSPTEVCFALNNPLISTV